MSHFRFRFSELGIQRIPEGRYKDIKANLPFSKFYSSLTLYPEKGKEILFIPVCRDFLLTEFRTQACAVSIMGHLCCYG